MAAKATDHPVVFAVSASRIALNQSVTMATNQIRRRFRERTWSKSMDHEAGKSAAAPFQDETNPIKADRSNINPVDVPKPLFPKKNDDGVSGEHACSQSLIWVRAP